MRSHLIATVGRPGFRSVPVDEGEVEVSRLALEMADAAVAAFGLEVGHLPGDALLAAAEHGWTSRASWWAVALTARGVSSRRRRERWQAPMQLSFRRAEVAAMCSACPARFMRLGGFPRSGLPPLMQVPAPASASGRAERT